MLNDQEIEQLLQTLRNKYGDAEVPDGYSDFIGPEQLRDFSDHFDISVDKLRTLPAKDMWRLETELFASDETPLPFEYEQGVIDTEKKIEKAGGIIPYLKQWQEERAKKKIPTSPLLPKQKYR